MTNDSSVIVDAVTLKPDNDLVRAQFRVKSVAGNRLELIGWAFGLDAAIEQIEIVARGQVVAKTTTTEMRPDVAEAFPNTPQAGQSGFKIAIEAEGRGVDSLELHAVLDDGTIAPVGTLSVTAPPRSWSERLRRR
jgi:hypothetical protein